MPSTVPEAAPAMSGVSDLMRRAEGLMTRIEAMLGDTVAVPDFAAAQAFRFRRRRGRVVLEPITRVAPMSFADLKVIERQKAAILKNTRQFVAGLPANNVLLTGARGTGKSSLVRACLNTFSQDGLRVVEIDKNDLIDLTELVDILAPRPERFIVFCDDLSFEEGEAGYKALKAALDGSISAASENVLIYATSNRRHLMPEHMRDNLTVEHQADGEIHPGEVIEEKISLSERFGLWLSFYPFRQDEYLAIVAQWLNHYDCGDAVDEAREEALRFALERGSRSGRVALQFARDYAGRRGLDA